MAYLIQHMRKREKQPMWGAVESRSKLVAKLGFVTKDRIFAFEPARNR